MGLGVAAAQDQPPPQSQPATQSTDPPAAVPAVDAPPLARVQERIDQLEGDASIDQAAKEALLGPLRIAVQSLQDRDDALAKRQEFLDAAAAAPATHQQLQRELDQPVSLQPLEDFSLRPPDEALDAIRAVLREAQARQDAAQAEVQALQQASDAREVALAQGPTQLVQWREELAELTTGLAALPADPTDPAAQARRWQQQAAAAELAARIARLEAELASYRARRELLPVRQSLAQRKLDTASRLIERLRELETEAANRKARQAQQLAEQQASEVADPRLSRLAEATGALAAQRLGRQGTLARLDAIQAEHAREQSRLADLQRRAANTAARVRAAGLTELVGRSLRDELARLPEVDPELNDRLSDAVGQAQFELINIEDELAEFGDVQSAIARFRRELSTDDQPLSPRLDQQIESIVTNYHDMLVSLRDENRRYIDEALDLVTTRETLATTTEAFRTYIEERILWTRSVQGPAVPSVQDLTHGVVWLLGGEVGLADQHTPIGTKWLEALGDLWPPNPLVFPLALAFLVSLWARRRAAKGLKTVAAQVRKFATDRFSLTLAALPYTVLMAVPLPLSMVLAGLLLEGTGPSVSSAVGAALLDASTLAFGLEFVRRAARNDGLAEAHFRWRRESLSHLWRLVFLLEMTLIPLAVIAFAYAEQPETSLNDGVGRLAFIASQLLIAAFLAWLLAPWQAFVRPYRTKHAGGLVNQTRWLWYPLLVAVPVAFAVLAALGYYYTAAKLDQRLQLTLWLLVVILVGYSMVLRWLFIERRRLLVKRAQQKREAEREGQEGPGSGGGEVEGIELETPAELDAAEVDTQTRRVLFAAAMVSVVLGVYSLWTEQLPALRMLDRIQLYPSIEFTPTEDSQAATPTLAQEASPPTVEQSNADGNDGGAVSSDSLFGLGAESGGQSEPVKVITLADVGAALIFFALTYVLARNLPGLLEITILKRLPLDGGARFAVTSILRYIIAIVGILLAFSAIGIGWSQVQFLAAALTFGLAFGLQEIFANFISGLIMLIERPVRVGDTVTVNNINGRVTRIRMRATTVLDWELRELIIPNKVFITDQFINWTLSDPRIRVTIQVGVSYGSDVRLVQRTLLEIGQTQEHVLPEPRVRALFLGFGDSTLNYELRVYVDHFDFFLDVRSDLHTRIAERFRELDIEIAFPQRDLNIRNIGPLAEALAHRSSAIGSDTPGDTP